jgi:two-component system sensor histidine kinase QseC
LAAIRTHAEVALAADDRRACREALEGVLAGTERATQLVSQLLALARIDAAALAGSLAPVELVGIVRSVMADYAPQAMSKGVEIALALGDDAPSVVSGNAELLAVLVRNLVDNALRHTPIGGQVKLALRRRDDEFVLTVDDTGPGIPIGLRTRVRDRFFRSGPSGQGAGLGLSIVEAIALLHAGTLDLSDRPDGPGLRVTVKFPADVAYREQDSTTTLAML